MKKIIIILLFLVPSISLAVSVGSVTPTYVPDTYNTGSCSFANQDFKGLIFNVIGPCFLNPVFYLIYGLSMLTFIYGVFKYMVATGNDKQQGRDQIVWGLIGLAVMSSIWMLVSLITHTVQ